MDLIPIRLHKIMQSHAYTVIILGNDTKRFAIYTDPHVGESIQLYLTEEPKSRPHTHDFLNGILKGLEVKVVQVIIEDLEDTVYFSRLFLTKEIGDETHVLEIDARPSDSLIMALMNNAKLYCRKSVMDKAVAVED